MPGRLSTGLKRLVGEMRAVQEVLAPVRLTLVVDGSLSATMLQSCEEFGQQLAEYAGEPVELSVVDDATLNDLRGSLGGAAGEGSRRLLQPRAPLAAAPMSAAEFIWREDGRPDWEAMWSGFCELALYGGPPHRGEDATLRAPEGPVSAAGDPEAMAEIRRGIWETTGLFAELDPDEPGWIAITCHSRKMAAWLCATIILENVEARFEDERLFLPASPSFHLKDEVKSVITVVAKCNHYWQAHIEATEGATRAYAATS